MSRSASESSRCVVPACGMQVPPLQSSVKPATGIDDGPVTLEFAMFAKSTWNFQRKRLVEVPSDTK